LKTKFTLIAVLVISLSGTCNMAFAKEQKTQDKTVTKTEKDSILIVKQIIETN